MSRRNGYRREGSIEADVRHGSTSVGGEMGSIIHDRGVATAHPCVRVVEGLTEWGSDADRCGRLGKVGSLREKLWL